MEGIEVVRRKSQTPLGGAVLSQPEAGLRRAGVITRPLASPFGPPSTKSPTFNAAGRPR
jgi:hypothetical protein